MVSFRNGKSGGFLYDRSAERLLQYPQNLILGAGEGYFERFPLGILSTKLAQVYLLWNLPMKFILVF